MRTVLYMIVLCALLFVAGYLFGLSADKANCHTDEECQQAYEQALDVAEGAQK